MLLTLAEIAASSGLTLDIREDYQRRHDFDPKEVRRLVDFKTEHDTESLKKVFFNFEVNPSKDELKLFQK